MCGQPGAGNTRRGKARMHDKHRRAHLERHTYQDIHEHGHAHLQMHTRVRVPHAHRHASVSCLPPQLDSNSKKTTTVDVY